MTSFKSRILPTELLHVFTLLSGQTLHDYFYNEELLVKHAVPVPTLLMGIWTGLPKLLSNTSFRAGQKLYTFKTHRSCQPVSP